MSKISPFRSLSSSSSVRRISLVLYCPVEFLHDVLFRKQDVISNYAYCFHDQDLRQAKDDSGKLLFDEFGSPVMIPKEPHVHLILLFRRSVSPSTVFSWFYRIDENGLKETVTGSGINDVYAAYEYLIHRFDPDKAQYSEVRRKCSDRSFFERDRSWSDSLLEATEELLSGASTYSVLCKYGRDFIIHQRDVFDLVQRIRAESLRRPEHMKAYNDPLLELYEID